MAAKKRKAAKAAVDPHADCPPAVWSGMNWECRNHGAEGVAIARAREPMAVVGAKGPTAAAPSPAAATKARELVELQAVVASLSERVAALESR